MAIVVVIKDTQNARMYGQEVKLMQKYNQNHLYNKTLRPDGDFSVMSASFSLSLNDILRQNGNAAIFKEIELCKNPPDHVIKI